MPRIQSSVFALVVVVACSVTVVHGLARPGAGAQAGQAAATGRSVDDLRRPIHFDTLRALETFFERVDVASIGANMRRPPIDRELDVIAFAAGLPADWEAPFVFVQGAIGHVPYGGSVRGARGALESGGGNALDQSRLLAELMRARGVPTRYVRGRLNFDDAAMLVLGTSTPSAPQPGDPWPRWLEVAADHWWLQAERDGEWIDLDPSFADTAAGEARAVVAETYPEPPEEVRTRVRFELRRGGLVVASTEEPAEQVVGQTAVLSFAAESEDAVVLWRTAERLVGETGWWLEGLAIDLGLLPSRPAMPAGAAAVGRPARQGTTPAPGVGAARRPWRPSAFSRLFLDAQAGPWAARFALPGAVLEAGPFDRGVLDALSVRITVITPDAPEHTLDVPWGGGPEGALAVVIGAGAVPDARLAMAARPLYAALNRLAGLEQASRVSMLPPISYYDAAATLDSAAREAWDAFERDVPVALAWSILQGFDRATAAGPGGRVVREGLRLASVRWRPPSPTAPGSLEVSTSDPVTVGRLSGIASAAALRAANGLLQSAVLSQILNRVVERAPETAFDVTLRAIGTGRDIVVFHGAEELPEDWPAVARAEANLGLQAGYAVLAPVEFGDGAPGWWHVGAFDGEMVGWIPGPQTALQGRVAVGAPARLDRLEPLLASLPSLHRAVRWLAELPGGGANGLSSVPTAACASAAVAAGALVDTLPAGYAAPEVLSLCVGR